MPAKASGDPSWWEALGYLAVTGFVLGCLGLAGSLMVACDQADGFWTDAVITSIDYDSGQCTYELAWTTATAECPETPDRGQPFRVYVMPDSSTGRDLIELREPSWRELAPYAGGSVALCVLGMLLWGIVVRNERYQTHEPAGPL